MSPRESEHSVAVTWLTQGGFLIEVGGFRLVIDPYMSDSLGDKVTRLAPFPLALGDLRPDAVLCSHDHIDHLDSETVMMIAGRYPRCLFGGPERAFRHLSELGIAKPLLLEIGKSVALGPFSITPTFARHSDPSAVGLAIEAEGRKIYLSADTEFDERLFTPLVAGADLLLVCINGRLGNMPWRDAVEVAKRLRPKKALPMHYGLFAENTEDPAPFVAACREAGIDSFEMRPGEAFRI